MNTQDFCYWLQGYFELSGADGGLSKEQVEVIKEHLQLVFKKQTVKAVDETVKKVSSLPKLSEDDQKRVQDLIREYEREVFKYKTAWPSDPSTFKPGIIPPYEVTCSSRIEQYPDDMGKLC